jgi:hypothetical protein
MFLPAQLICRSKLGAKLSSYYMWREGGPHLFNAQAGRKKWRCEFGFNCTRWNTRKPGAHSFGRFFSQKARDIPHFCLEKVRAFKVA